MATQFTAVVFLRIVDYNTFPIALISVTHNKKISISKITEYGGFGGQTAACFVQYCLARAVTSCML